MEERALGFERGINNNTRRIHVISKAFMRKVRVIPLAFTYSSNAFIAKSRQMHTSNSKIGRVLLRDRQCTYERKAAFTLV